MGSHLLGGPVAGAPLITMAPNENPIGWWRQPRRHIPAAKSKQYKQIYLSKTLTKEQRKSRKDTMSNSNSDLQDRTVLSLADGVKKSSRHALWVLYVRHYYYCLLHGFVEMWDACLLICWFFSFFSGFWGNCPQSTHMSDTHFWHFVSQIRCWLVHFFFDVTFDPPKIGQPILLSILLLHHWFWGRALPSPSFCQSVHSLMVIGCFCSRSTAISTTARPSPRPLSREGEFTHTVSTGAKMTLW